MKKFILISSLLAAGTLGAWAEIVNLSTTKTQIAGPNNSMGAGNTYVVSGESDGVVNGVLQLGGAWGTNRTGAFTGTVTGTGTLEMYFEGGNGGNPYQVTISGADFSGFIGQLAVVNNWNIAAIVRIAGENFSGTEYLFPYVSHEKGWSVVRTANNSVTTDTLNLTGNTTLAGITGTSKGYTLNNSSVNDNEFITAAAAGTELKLAGDGTYSYYGTVGASGTEISLNKTGTGTQIFGGTSYFGSVTVSAGTLELGGTVSLESAISNSSTVKLASDVIFNLTSNLLNSGSTDTYTLINNINGGTLTVGDSGSWDSTNITEANFILDGYALSARTSVTVSSVGAVKLSGSAYNLYYKANADFSGSTGTEWYRDSYESATTSTFAAGDNIFFTVDATIYPSSAKTVGTVSVTNNATLTVRNHQDLTWKVATIASGSTLEFYSTDQNISKKFSGSGKIIVNSSKSNHDMTMDLGAGNDFTGTLKWSGNLNPTNISNLNSAVTLVLAGGRSSLWSKDAISFANKVVISGTYGVHTSYSSGVTFTNGLAGEDSSASLASNTGLTVSGGKVEGTLSISGTGAFSVGANATVEADSLTLAGTGAKTISGTTTATSITLNSGTLAFSGDKSRTIGTLTIGDGLTVSMTHTNNLIKKLSLSGDSATLQVANVADNNKIVIGALSGSGTLTFDSNVKSTVNTLYVLGDSSVTNVGDFTGTILLKGTAGTGGVRPVNIVINNENIAAGAIINLDSNTVSDSTVSLGVNASKVKIAGLKSGEALDSDAHVFSGTPALSATAYTGSTTVNELTISNTTDCTYYGTVTGVALVKEGTGTQEIAGVIADYVDSSNNKGASKITVKAGELVLSKANTYTGGTTISGGKLIANNASALGAGTTQISGGGQLTIGSASAVTLSGSAIEIVLDSYAGADTAAAILGYEGSSISLGTGETIALSIVSATALEYHLFDSAIASSYTTGSFSLSEAMELAGWSIADYNISTGVITLAIPEPSMFGLLASTLALALAGTRRRRKNAK